MRYLTASLLACCLTGPLAAESTIDAENAVKIIGPDPAFTHGFGDRSLTYEGRKFRHVISPGYAVTPDHKGIIFVTQGENSPAMLHYLPFLGTEALEVNLGDSGFGAGIGFPADDWFSQYIEGTNGESILFAARYGRGAPIRHYALNLGRGTFVELPAPAEARVRN